MSASETSLEYAGEQRGRATVKFNVAESDKSSKVYRRQSAVSRPQFAVGAFDGIQGSSSSKGVIPPPLPESLPTTPGYELNGTSYFDRPAPESAYTLPQQQTVLASNDAVDEPELEDVSHGLAMDTYPRNKWRLVSGIIFSLTAGLSDGAPGALLPHVENYYGISYTVVSMIWMANAVGYIVVAVLSHKIEDWLGPSQMLSVGCGFLVVMYSIVSPAPPFAVVAVAFFFGGMGLAMNFSYLNIFLGRFKNNSTYLGFFHGGYGLGACIGPLLATAMVNAGVRWSHFYFILLALSAFNCINMLFAFKGYAEEIKAWELYEPMMEEGHSPGSNVTMELVSITTAGGTKKKVKPAQVADFTETNYEAVNPDNQKSESSKELHAALRATVTWLLSLFVLFYQGAEVSMGGWVVTFLEVYRGGSTRTTGYIASGFWGGMTLGRVFITPNIHRFIGAKRGNTLLVIGGIVCCLLAWVLPILIVEAVFVALFGLFTGPIYPLMITIAVRVLPRKIQIISLTIMTAVGSSGGALFPFLVGLLSQHVGAFVVMPCVLVLLALTMFIWALLPNPDRTVVKRVWERLW